MVGKLGELGEMDAKVEVVALCERYRRERDEARAECERLESELHGAIMVMAVLCRREGGVIEIRPGEYLDLSPGAVLHTYTEHDGRVLYSVLERAAAKGE